MSVLIQTDQLRTLLVGSKVDRTTQTIPQTAQAALFTVSGGRILLTSLVGEVTTVIGGTATTLTIVGNPTTGTDVNIGTATAITSKEVGSLIGLAGTVGTALNVQSAGAGSVPTSGVIVPIGTLDWLTSASTTGAIKWSLTYVPFDNGASVTAA
ncbi:hypothetical protein ACWCQW_03120 [Streptomyces mirabilis]